MNKILDRQTSTVLDGLRAQGKRSLHHGCFDIITSATFRSLREAKKTATFWSSPELRTLRPLIRGSGAHRPRGGRADVMAALEMVVYVTLSTRDNPG
jgi:hypothetical protein